MLIILLTASSDEIIIETLSTPQTIINPIDSHQINPITIFDSKLPKSL